MLPDLDAIYLFIEEQTNLKFPCNKTIHLLKPPTSNEHNTPFLDSVFKTMHELTTENTTLCFVNSDIILGEDFTQAVKQINWNQFLLVGQRSNIKLEKNYQLEDINDVTSLQKLAKKTAQHSGYVGSDYFCYTSSSGFNSIPPLLVGRAAWDNWMMYRARELNIPLIDASDFITAVHQDHDYEHIHRGSITTDQQIDQWDSPESRAQRALIGAKYFDLRHSSHFLSRNGSLKTVPFNQYVKSEEVIYKRSCHRMSIKGLFRRFIVRCPFFIKNRIGVYRTLPN